MKKLVAVKLRWERPSRRIAIIAIVVAAIVLGTGICYWRQHHTKPIHPASDVVTYSTDQPSEDKPGDDFKWQGQPNDPKKVTIASIGVDGFVQKVGVDQHQEVAVPNNIHVAGWFVDTVRPGDKGLSVLDGHLNGNYKGGIFEKLEKVQKDDEIGIEFGDGSRKTFKVTDVQSIKTADTPSVLFSQSPGISNQLNLITCGGTWNQAAHQYENRIVVIATLVK